jgi:uncharacterized oxidoreductase
MDARVWLMRVGMQAEPIVVGPSALSDYVRAILAELGARSEDAALVSESLVAANLAGHDSHGVLLLPFYAELVRAGRIRLDACPELVIDRAAVVVIDAHDAFGQVVGRIAADLAIARAREHGIAAVLGRNATHLGRLGEYTAAIAEAGLVAILFCNFQGGEQQLAPFGGSENRLTNNPISIAAPGDVDPVLLDMALSVVAGGKVWLAKARGEPLPEGWILDAAGRPSTDPDDLDAGGSLLPVGGLEACHKGYGLIVLVDVLAGILSAGGVCRPDAGEFSNAFLLIAIDVEPLVPRDRYRSELDQLASHVKSARRLPGVEEILLPGEPEARTARQRSTEGIPIEPSTWQALVELGNDLGVEAPIT